MDEQNFSKVRAEQRLNCRFEDFPRLIETVLGSAAANPDSHQVDVYVAASGRAVLEVFTRNEMRNFLLLTFEFAAAPDKLVEAGLFFRFSLAQARNRLLEARLLEIYRVVRHANPSLAQQVKGLIWGGE